MAIKSEISLYYSPGACSRVSMIALEEIGVDFMTHRVLLANGENKLSNFRALNTRAKVPVLVTEDGVLVESIAILVYLARKYPHSNLLPDVNSWKYVEALSLLAWCTSALHPLVTRLRLPTRFCDLPGADARVRDLAREEMVTQLRIAEQSLLNRPWMLGDTWSIVDGYLLWIWARCPESGIEAGMFPNLVSHETRSMARSAVQRAIKREIKP